MIFSIITKLLMQQKTIMVVILQHLKRWRKTLAKIHLKLKTITLSVGQLTTGAAS
jgi:hypothetical protein